MSRRSRKAAPKAIAGAASAGMTTLCAIPCQRTPFEPDWTSAAPTRPPISACEELDGRPNHHVRRFQAIAPARLATAAMSTATRGVTARVPTEVAIAFAVSWKPFVKSKPSETTMTTTRRTSFNSSAVLHDDRLEDVGCVLARVDSL